MHVLWSIMPLQTARILKGRSPPSALYHNSIIVLLGLHVSCDVAPGSGEPCQKLLLERLVP